MNKWNIDKTWTLFLDRDGVINKRNFDSIMVGDTDSDILFGKNLGMKTVRVLSEEKASVSADMEINGLDELITKLTHEE